jgi:hypothetical protein
VNIHPSITSARIIDAVERHNTSLDNPGFCIECGIDVEGVEPDAQAYACENCGYWTVYGAEELFNYL